MRPLLGGVASATVFVLFQVAAAVAASDAPAREPPASSFPPSYTFRVDVAMAMRHFPWLHFHMQGDGEYQPGESYVVHFTTIPWFLPKQRHDADLSMLDPNMWPKRFTYEEIAQRPDGERLFLLHAIDDPTLKVATVTLGPHSKAHSVDAIYNDGSHIQMTVNRSIINGFWLPATMTAQIDEPGMALSASADFKDYDFAGEANSPLR
jgi:hypothetical protein